jgi:hypothetical protein
MPGGMDEAIGMAFRERTVLRWIGAVSLLPVVAVTAFAGLAFGRSTISR